MAAASPYCCNCSAVRCGFLRRSLRSEQFEIDESQLFPWKQPLNELLKASGDDRFTRSAVACLKPLRLRCPSSARNYGAVSGRRCSHWSPIFMRLVILDASARRPRPRLGSLTYCHSVTAPPECGNDSFLSYRVVAGNAVASSVWLV